jgi:hypothetical protein
MMHPDFSRALAESIQETFENMAFLETVPAEGENTPGVAEPMTARLEISFPAEGVVHLTLSAPLLRSIGEILHGSPAGELSRDDLQDLLFELVNTIVGVTLNKFLPEDQTYGLGLPSGVDRNEPETGRVQRYAFLVDDTPVTVSVAGGILSREA